MEVKINVDECRFKDILEKELEAFTKEELHSIIESALKEYLVNSEIMSEVFLNKKINTWNNTVTYEPTGILAEVVKKVDISPMFEDVKKSVLEILSKEENVKKAAQELFGNIIQRGIMNMFSCDNQFLSGIAYQVKNIINPMD